MRFRPLLVALLSIALLVGDGTGSCLNSEADIHIAASHNQTGHWTVDVNVGQTTEKQRSSGPVRIHLKPKMTRCGATHVSSMEITLRDHNLGYEFVPRVGYYKMHSSADSWEKAKAICESEGTHLAIINSEAEAAAIKALVERFPESGDYFYMGFSDVKKEGYFVTIFDEPLQTAAYVRWEGWEPSNGTSENCGALSRRVVLHDYGCTSKVPFICELEI